MTIEELSVVISADVSQLKAGMAAAEASLGRIGTTADATAGRYTDAQGRMRSATGQFVSSATLAAEQAARLGGSLATIGTGATGAAGAVGRFASVNAALAASFKEADDQRQVLNAGFGRLGESAKEVGTGFSTYVTLPLVGLGAAAVKIGGDFESAFNRVQAATQASGAELASLREKAQNIALDPQLKFSSVEAAQALENLAKNGLNATQILGGAVDATTALATATGGTLATAADITTDVISAFGKSASEAAGLVSNITGATIASKFGIDDYKLALGQAGAVAGQLGVDFKDFNTALSVTSAGFSSGSDAGTSFKSFLQRLVPTSKEAEESIKKLGLNFFDTQGKMLPLRDIAGQLQQAFKGLSDQAKNTEGTKIFGADSIRTALLLAKDGAEGFDKMAASIGKVSAASQGAILSQGFVGSYEAFKSSLEGLGQAIADSGLLSFVTNLAKQGAELASSLAQADPDLLRFGVGIAAAAAAVGPLLVAIGALGAAVPAIAAGLTLLTGPVGIAALAIAGLTAGIVALVATNAGTGESIANVSKRLTEQKAAAQELHGNITPLLDSYDTLKKKSSLTTIEQAQLRSIIEKVGAQIPTTVTQFDAYGKALDINSEAARGFVKRQQEIAEVANKVELTKQREEFKKLQVQIAATTAALNEVNKDGVHVKVFFDSGGGGFQALTDKEITDLQAKLEGLRASSRGVGGLIDQLKGIPPPIKEAADAADKLKAPLTQLGPAAAGASDAVTKAFAKLRAELAALSQLDEVLARPADGVDLVNRRVKALEAGLKSLLTAGADPTSAAFKTLATEALTLQQGLDKLQADKPLDFKIVPTVKIDGTFGDKIDEIFAKTLSPELANHPLTVPFTVAPLKTDFSTDILNQNIALDNSFVKTANTAAAFSGAIGASFSPAAARFGDLQAAIKNLIEQGINPFDPAIKALVQQSNEAFAALQLESFNDKLNAALVAGLADIATGFGEGIGNILAGAGGLNDLASLVLAPIGGLAVQLGQLAIGAGLAVAGIKASLESLNPVLAIAGGIALVALGTAVKGAAKRLSTSSGGSAGASSSAGSGLSSAPRTNYTPKPTPKEADQITVIHQINLLAKGADLAQTLEIHTGRKERILGSGR